jgi:Tol biopolymer transport system component
MVNPSLSDALSPLSQRMRHLYRSIAIILALSGLAPLSAQPRCAAASGARRIAFVRRQNSVNHIYLMDADASGAGAHLARLTNDAEPENYPSWSPDGTRLAYQRDLNGSAIYVIGADGTGQLRLSPAPGFDVTPSWSPDGSQIVYARLLAVPQPNQPPMTDIRVMNADGTGDHAILANTLFSVEPRWSVNNQLVFMSLMSGGDLQVYVMNIDGGSLRELTSAGNNGDPVWSPDGTRITFGSDREGGNKLNIFAMNADGGQQGQLTHFDVPYEAGDANWSSDARKITFQYDINGAKQSDPNAYAEVWTMNPDGTGQTSTGVQCSDVGCAPRWQPRIARVFRRPECHSSVPRSLGFSGRETDLGQPIGVGPKFRVARWKIVEAENERQNRGVLFPAQTARMVGGHGCLDFLEQVADGFAVPFLDEVRARQRRRGSVPRQVVFVTRGAFFGI